MFSLKFLTAVLFASCVFMNGTRMASDQSNSNVAMPQTVQGKTATDLKILAQGIHSRIQNAFVAVIRDAQTYAELRKAEPQLPKLDQEFFESSVAVAAFLGERNTGGYSVEITREGGGILVTEKKPGKSMMVTQMITFPFELVSVPAPGTSPIAVAYSDPNSVKQSYDVTNGNFTNSGGLVGRIEEYGVEGKVDVIREGNLATFSFFLKNTGETNEHLLLESVTGLIRSGGEITIRKMSAWTLVSVPNSGLEAKGEFTNH
ncbi:MAG TPA: protease complex subunit PrcB family protein, partial [Pyrinomonadaceae bacterium]